MSKIKKQIKELRAFIIMKEHEISVIPTPITEEWLIYRNKVNTDIYLAQRKIDNLRNGKGPLGDDLGVDAVLHYSLRKYGSMQPN